MFTKEEIDKAFEQPNIKTWSGDDPKLDFEDGIFTGDNWNDARLNVLRETLDDLFDQYACDIEIDDGSIILFHNYLDDQHYVFIIETTDAYKNVWHIEWYKRRGRIEELNINGRPASLNELRELLYKLNGIDINV